MEGSEGRIGQRIDQTIFVERDGQKAIVIGKGGQTIKKIGEAARLELEKCWQKGASLSPQQSRRTPGETVASTISEWGLEFPKDQ